MLGKGLLMAGSALAVVSFCIFPADVKAQNDLRYGGDPRYGNVPMDRGFGYQPWIGNPPYSNFRDQPPERPYDRARPEERDYRATRMRFGATPYDGEYRRWIAVPPYGLSDGLEDLEIGLDIDGDGAVDANEASYVAVARFDRLDANDDDRVTREEYMQADRDLTIAYWDKSPDYENVREIVEKRFSKLDGPDQDGIITRAEFIERTRSVFQTADADDDGKVDVWEYRSVRMPG